MTALKKAAFIVLLFQLILHKQACAFLFGEHATIGNKAFKSFITAKLDGRFETLNAVFCFKQAQQWNYASDTFRLLFPLNTKIAGVTFGELTGLAGDHALSAMQLFSAINGLNLMKWYGLTDTLNYQNNESRLVRVLQAHRTAKGLGASDGTLTKIQGLEYVRLAMVDKSHFYQYGLPSVAAHLQDANENYFHVQPTTGLNFFTYFVTNLVKTDAAQLAYQFNTGLIDSLFTKLLNANAISKYSVLHAIAIQSIQKAAQIKLRHDAADSAKVRFHIQMAFVFEAFALHFIQDAFASGHLSVNRYKQQSLNDHGVHDYYNRVGQVCSNTVDTTVNWTAYGDGFLASSAVNEQKAVEACVRSLEEVWMAYTNYLNQVNSKGLYGSKFLVIMVNKLNNDTARTAFWMDNFSVLNEIPKALQEGTVKMKHSMLGPSLRLEYRQSIHSSSPLDAIALSSSFFYFTSGFNPQYSGRNWRRHFEYKTILEPLSLTLNYNLKAHTFDFQYQFGINWLKFITLYPIGYYAQLGSTTAYYSVGTAIQLKSLNCNFNPYFNLFCLSPFKRNYLQLGAGLNYYF